MLWATAKVATLPQRWALLMQAAGSDIIPVLLIILGSTVATDSTATFDTPMLRMSELLTVTALLALPLDQWFPN